jgi:hypothetical protein
MALKHRLHPGSYNPFFLLCQLLMWWSSCRSSSGCHGAPNGNLKTLPMILLRIFFISPEKNPGIFYGYKKFGKLLNTSSKKKSLKLFFLIALVCISEISIQKFPCHPPAQQVAPLKVPFRISSYLFFQEFSLAAGPVLDQTFGHLKVELETEC